MTQEVLVDLDLHLNRITRIADAVQPTDAVAYGQLGNFVQVPPPAPGTDPGTIIVWDGNNWVYVNPDHPSAPVSKDTEIVVSDGLVGGGPLSSDVTIGFNFGDAIVFDDSKGGVTALLGTGLVFEPLATDQAIAVDQDWLTDQIGTGDTSINERIDAITITGSGAAIVTKDPTQPPDSWTVHVESLHLANTYVGPAFDAVGITAELAARVPPIVGQPGDLYINDSSGQAFICTGQPAPNDWVALASAEAGIAQITSLDGSLTVQASTGPITDLSVGPTLQTEIDNKVDETTQVLGGLGLGGGGALTGDVTLDVVVEADSGLVADDNALWVNTGEGIKRDIDGISIDRTEVDTWYPAIPPTTPPPPPGTTIVWDGDSWELVLPGELPPPMPPGTLIGGATVVVVENVLSGTQTVLHNLGNNNVTVAVKDGACHVAARVCDSGANAVELQTDVGGPYTVIITGIKTA